MDRFDYFYGMEAEQYSFFRMPKVLFQNERFAKISCEAKVLYGIMLDRMGLSKKNGWLDEHNRVYIIFTVEEIMEMLGCSKPTALKMLAQLDTQSGIGLIERQRKRFNCPTRIYVKNFIRLIKNQEEKPEEPEQKTISEKKCKGQNGLVEPETKSNNAECTEEQTRLHTKNMQQSEENRLRLKNFTSKQEEIVQQNVEVKHFNHDIQSQGKEFLPQEESRSKKTLPLEVKKFDPINTEYSNTDSKISNLSINHNTTTAGVDDADRWRDKIKEQIEYSCLCTDYKTSIELIDELVELMVEIFMNRNGKVRISGEYYASSFVQSRLAKLNMLHIQYVLDCLQSNCSQIRNIKSYLLTALFNAPATINSFYQQKVNADCRKVD